MTDAKHIQKEAARRRTFAIISHPDAGKTTLTEKLLLFGGVIQLAGAVKAKRGRANAVSDWMEMERERGISITTSVLQFPYQGLQMNLLDTPGHADFSEDTYRTLHAVDGAVMLLDSAKGVESQTRKLFRVCKHRSIPIFTFVNKMDRPGRDPFDLVGEVESMLGIGVFPITWPVFRSGVFRGIYHRIDRQRVPLRREHGRSSANRAVRRVAASRSLASTTPCCARSSTRRDTSSCRRTSSCWTSPVTSLIGSRFQAGEISPMFFGSAINNFGLEAFLETFCELMPPPGPRKIRRRHRSRPLTPSSAASSSSFRPT